MAFEEEFGVEILTMRPRRRHRKDAIDYIDSNKGDLTVRPEPSGAVLAKA
jgi:hypothetical protein